MKGRRRGKVEEGRREWPNGSGGSMERRKRGQEEEGKMKRDGRGGKRSEKGENGVRGDF